MVHILRNGQKTILPNKWLQVQAKTVPYGIPQGTCFGSLLFILYVNNFEQCLENGTLNMYTDDLTCSSEDIEKLCTDICT